MNAPAADATPYKVTDLLFGTYRESIPARNKDRFHALLDALAVSRANPTDPRDSNPEPQQILDALDTLDALVDPYRPLTEEARRTRGLIRLAALEQRDRAVRDRLRQECGEMPL